MTTTLHPHTDPNFSTDTVKAPLWKNLFFTKDGKAHRGTEVHPSEEGAREIVEAGIARIAALAAQGKKFEIESMDGRFPFESFSHFFPAPWTSP
jgi:hypothetical protein